ncbi:MAG: CoA transferase [Myxococcales bacterium]|nr:MAG: CoA transferase [Myxococcales bacterium]
MADFLSGVRVMDLSRLLPGPFASLMLAEMGAEVIKVESAGAGDYARRIPPFVGDVGALYLAINRGKRSLAVDFRRPEGREIVLRLAKVSDVALEGFRPGALDAMGLGYEALRAANPRLILASITGYGQDGPYRLRAGHDLNYQALAGLVAMTGRRGQPPGLPGMQAADLAGSFSAVAAILAALFRRERTGEGAHLDVSMSDAMTALQPVTMAGLLTDDPSPARGETALQGLYVCYNLYETKDGRHMALAALEPKFYSAFCEAAGRPDLLSEQYSVAADGEAGYEAMKALFMSRTREEWTTLMADVDACCEAVLSPAEVKAHPHFAARGLLFETRTADGGRILQAAALPALGRSGKTLAPTARLGEHTETILNELGYEPAEIERLAGIGAIGR